LRALPKFLAQAHQPMKSLLQYAVPPLTPLSDFLNLYH
jgi:hypothetical protein